MSDLLSPFTCRGLTLRNRIVIPPMAQYSAEGGFANDYHLVHLGKFATGGVGLVFVEFTAVEPRGRTTPRDLGLWDDGHVPQLRRICEFVHSQGAAIGIQIAHAGRKGNQPPPWDGTGPVIDPEVNGFPVAPSPLAVSPECTVPQELTPAMLGHVRDAWVAAARRALQTGCDVLELHGAHGYLLHQFLSPLTNQRQDDYGGNLSNRMRFPLEVARAVRAVWPLDKPLFYRLSLADPADETWTMDDTVHFCRELKATGVDVIDCSYGGIAKRATTGIGRREQGFLLFDTERVRREAEVPTVSVGLIVDASFADEAVRRGRTDLVAVGRESLLNPHWALQAQSHLLGDERFQSWPHQYGWWLAKRAASLAG